MTPIVWAALGVVALGLVIAFVQIVDLRRGLNNVPTGDDQLLGMVRRVDNELGMVEASLAALDQRLASLETVFPSALRRSAVVMYDAYPGMVGSLSRSVAMLDENGDGFVVSVLVNRDESRFFLKGIRGAQGVEPLSPEETTAIGQALRR